MPWLVPETGPQRVMAASDFVNSLGIGMYFTAGVLYFTQAVGLPADQVGLGLGVAGVVALVSGVACGHLADRRGARGVYAVTLAVRAVAIAGFLLADDFWTFLVAVCVATGAQAAGLAARSPLIRSNGGARPQEFRAYLRAVVNLGISLGALLAGWAVAVGTRSAYDLLVLGNVIAVVGAAALLVLLPPVRPVPIGGGPRRMVLRDRPYTVLALLDGVMAVQFKVLTVAIPLWLFAFTTAPRWMAAGTVIVNTVIVVLFQVRASRNVDTPVAGGAAYRRAGVAFLLSCSLISLTAHLTPWATSALLMTAVVVHTVGELWQSAGNFEVSFGLAPDYATGQYLGVFALGSGLADAVGPSLLIALCITWGRPGWLVVGAIFTLTGLTVPFAVRSAQRAQLAERAPGQPGGEQATP